MSETLVVSPSWIGDAVLAHPLLVRLRARDPHGAIDVLAPDWVGAVYGRMPEVRRTIAFPFGHGELRLGERRRFAKALPRYDRAIVLPGSLKSALVPWFAAIPRAHRLERRNALRPAERPALPERVRPAPHRGALRGAGAARGRAARAPAPRAPARDRRAPGERRLSRSSALRAPPLSLPSRPAPSTGPPSAGRRGTSPRWHGPAPGAASGSGCSGRPPMHPSPPKIAALAGVPVTDLAGRTSLDEAIDLLSLAARVVTNDSGLMHVAAALDRPMAALFGSSSPEYTPPLSAKARVISLRLDCSPCFERECPLGHTNCLEKLDARASARRARLEWAHCAPPCTGAGPCESSPSPCCSPPARASRPRTPRGNNR